VRGSATQRLTRIAARVPVALLAASIAAACHREADGPGDGSAAQLVNVSFAAPQLLVGGVTQASATVLDAKGDTIAGPATVWSSLTPAVASITPAGVITGLEAGTATVRASSGNAFGEAQIVVKNPTAGSITFSRDTATITVPSGSTQLIATVRDTSGLLLVNPAIAWSSSAPLIAAVNSTGLVTAVAVGSAAITATIDGQTATANINVTITVGPNAPLIVSVNPEPLRPGGTFTVVGNNFAPTPAGNVVVVDGVAVTVNASTVNALSITLPTTFTCNPAHPVFIQVTANSLIGGGLSTLQVGNQRTLTVGQSVIVTDPTQVRCNEIDQTGGRYAVSVYNAYRSSITPTANGAVAITVRGAVPAGTPSGTPSAAVLSAARPPFRQNVGPTLPAFGGPLFDIAERLRRARNADQWHAQLLERNMDFLRTNAAAIRAGLSAPRRASASGISAQVVNVGNITTVKVPNLNATNFCITNTPIGVRTVFVGAHSIIVEDTTTVYAGGPTLAGQMDNYYQQLGQEFESVMYPIEVANFGNPLVMDAQLGGLGKVVMVFSPRVNGTAEGSILGFVVSCDFAPVTTAPSSNFGEYFYAAVPTSTALGYFDPGTRDSWMRLMRPTLIHEVKHITAFGERIAHNLPLEDLSWEEGMARNAEELYARTFYGTQAKQNTGYAASIGCDVQYANAASPCANRPLLMLRHFDALYTYLGAPEIVSMLGRTYATDYTFYASAWSVERWANDIFGTSDSQFLKNWTLSSVTGVANLEAQTGQPWEQSLGEWSLAMYTDQMPGFTPVSPHLQFLSWNLPDIWAGMCADLGPCTNPNNPSQLYPRNTPFNPVFEAFGNFTVSLTTLEGGSFTLFDISGAQLARQLIEIKSTSGGDPPSTVRVAIVRIQ
jgi:Bacterial Ig-like domain (group 2)